MGLENITAHYINLDFRTDRNQDIREKLSKLGFAESNITRFSALDGKKLSEDLVNKNLSQTLMIQIIKNNNNVYKSTELAVTLSHYFLLQKIIQNPNISWTEPIFIFEDDFFLNDKYLDSKPFGEIIGEIECFNRSLTQVYPDESTWDIIFLGGRFNIGFIPQSIFDESSLNFKKINENFYQRIQGKGMDWDRTLHNYVINKKSAIKLCEIIESNFTQKKPIRQIDHLYCSGSNGLKSFDYFPHIFYSPLNYTSDIQFSKLKIKTSNL